jgi:hypothetical protein
MEKVRGATVFFIGTTNSLRRGIPREEHVMVVVGKKDKKVRRVFYNSLQNFFTLITEDLILKKTKVNVFGEIARIDSDCSVAEGAPTIDASRIEILDADGRIAKVVT